MTYLYTNDYEKAIISFSNSIKLDSTLVESYKERVELYSKKGKYDLARADLELFKKTFSSEFYNEIKKTSYYEEIMKNTK